MEEKIYPPYMDYDVKTRKTMKKEILPYFLTVYDSEENKHEIVATDGYEIKEENGKYYAVKKQSKYPKTYEECCDMKKVRTFFIYYRVYQIHSGYGKYIYHTCDISLNSNEKANRETFNKILNGIGECDKEVLSWSLIEE